MEKISGVIITYNEEKRIEDCLKSLLPFCDEIILVDSFSTDLTLEIASKYTSKIFQRKFDTYVTQKDYATSLAENKWVFWIDADERVSDDLIQAILQLKTDGFKADGYMINRLSYYINGFYKYGGWYPDAKVRLFNKNYGNWGGEDPHDKIIMKSGARIGKIGKDVIHFSYRDLDHQIEKMNQFSSRSANEKVKAGQQLIVFHMVFNTIFKFVKCYIFQGGFLAGTKGLINSVINAFYVFSKYAKLWEMKNSKPCNYKLFTKNETADRETPQM